LVKRYAKGADSDATDALITHTLTSEDFDASEDGTGRGTPLTVAPTLTTKNEPAPSGETRYAWYAQSAAELGQVRRLTPTECERLQGFPDGWTIPDGPSLADRPSWYATDHRSEHDPQPDGPRYAAMGNAVTVPVIEWIGQRIVAVDAALALSGIAA
jgi:DNA (cytosine-5)-methyltransferase 1